MEHIEDVLLYDQNVPGEEARLDGVAMGNERLHNAMAAANVTIEAAAVAAQVDVKTVQRWMHGRLPHPRNRWALCSLLKEDESYLWPESQSINEEGRSTDEIVAAYAHRIQLPLTTWRQLIRRATRTVDVLGYAILFLVEQNPDLVSRLQNRAATGSQVRIALGDPKSLQVRERDMEEHLDGGLPARINTALHYLQALSDCHNVSLHLYNAPLYSSIFRFDDQMLVTPHLYGGPGYASPILHLRRLSGEGIFSTFVTHFERVWAISTPYAGANTSLSAVVQH